MTGVLHTKESVTKRLLKEERMDQTSVRDVHSVLIKGTNNMV